ncbi:hypothetical protein K439DRAFT_1357692 [Ramaria rubella]|nr:hypothetical protein K439DRAFT_1357692 [Ramaria rubella]
MSTLTVNDQNISFAYLDSGPLQNDTYVTLFLLHGHTFYSPIFQHLFPFASKYNVRIVAITRRDYSGSTLFTSAELDVLTSRQEPGDIGVKTNFLKERSKEIASFLDIFIQKNKLPKSDPTGKQGGVALLGWSLGNVQALAVVGLAQHLPKDLVDHLEPYFRTLVLYECPYHSLGFPPPQKSYHPLRDASIPIEEQTARFNSWVSGYFQHDGLAYRNASTLSYAKPSQHRRPTTDSLSPEELASLTDSAPGPRSEDPFFVGSDPKMMGHVREEVFFPSKVVWPKLKINSVWGEETTWSIPYGSWVLEDYVREETSKSRGQLRRPLAITPVKGANHFAHWDDPEKLMQVLADMLSS